MYDYQNKAFVLDFLFKGGDVPLNRNMREIFIGELHKDEWEDKRGKNLCTIPYTTNNEYITTCLNDYCARMIWDYGYVWDVLREVYKINIDEDAYNNELSDAEDIIASMCHHLANDCPLNTSIKVTLSKKYGIAILIKVINRPKISVRHTVANDGGLSGIDDVKGLYINGKCVADYFVMIDDVE